MKFEEAYKRLEAISREMEQPELQLEKAVELYSEAAKLAETCKKELEKAKIEVERIENN